MKFIKIKDLYCRKDTIKKFKNEAVDLEKTFVKQGSDKEILSRLYMSLTV